MRKLGYLLMFTIDPVQPLITNSRKASDMYAGSKLLSGLMRRVVSELKKISSVSVLVPIEETIKAQETSDMPNRLVAQFLTKDIHIVERIASQLEQEVRSDFVTTCMNYIKECISEKKGQELALQQLKNFLEVYWCVEHYEGENYQEIYQKLSHSIYAVKGIRPFSQNLEPWNRKCMLFPEYNAIFAKRSGEPGNETYPNNINPEEVCDISGIDTLHYAVKSREALSAIAMVKRIYGRKLEIYSLRQMLLRSRIMLTLRQLKGELVLEQVLQSWLEHLDFLKSGEGDMLANAVYDIEHRNGPVYEEYDEISWNNAEKMYQDMRKCKVRLSSYYALVKFDGDSMGEAFSKRKTPEEQGELSASISCFAKMTPGIIEKYQGFSVYAGGEDFLGFLPVDTFFDCLLELNQNFLQKVNLTFSAGVAIAHLMHPLKEVIAAADEMEGRAKQVKKKNSCVIELLKRGGEIVITPPYRFKNYGENNEFLEQEGEIVITPPYESEDQGENNQPGLKDLLKLVKKLNISECSKSLLYHIGELFRCFQKEEGSPKVSMAEILIYDAVVTSGAEAPEELTRQLLQFYETDYGLEGFLNTLNAASFLAREVTGCFI